MFKKILEWRSRGKNRYIMSKEGDKFLQILNNNGENINLYSYLGSGGFASVYSIKGKQNTVCRITHKTLPETLIQNELKGLEIQNVLSGHDNIVKINEYGSYIVHDDTVANKYCKERPGEDWCHEEDEPERTNRWNHFANIPKDNNDNKDNNDKKVNNGVYAVMERIESDLYDYSNKLTIEKLSKVGIEQSKVEEAIEDAIDKIHYIFMQLMNVVSYIHENNYVHRDIKLENIGIVFEEGKIKIKLFDFGFAVNTTELTGVNKAGTLGYFDNLLYVYDGSTKKLITPTRQNLEFSEVYACGISMLSMIANFLNEDKAFDSIIDEDYNAKYNMIQRLKNIAGEKIKNEEKLTLLRQMLTIIQNCIIDIAKVNENKRDGRLTAEQTLEFLKVPPLEGGKKKSKKTKTKKTNKKKSKKKKNKTKKSKRIKTKRI